MNPILYALFAYGLTAVLSYVVIAIIVGVDLVINRKETGDTREEAS